MPIFSLLAFVAFPFIEIYIFIAIGSQIGFLATIVLLMVLTLVGVALIRTQGLAILFQVRQSLARGESPGAEVLDRIFLMLAGALLVIPGFISDAGGFLLLIPPIRRIVGNLIFQTLLRSGRVHMKKSHPEENIIDGDFHEVDHDSTKIQ